MKAFLKKLAKKMYNLLKGKKRLPVLIGLAAAWAVFCALLVLLGMWKLVVALHVALVLLAAILLFALHVNTKWLAKERPSSYFQDLTKRNMDAIAVGSTKAWKYLKLDGLEKKVFNCLTYRRALAMDFATLKTYFSHVRPDGKVFLFVDWKEINRLGFTVYARDWDYVHPHVFLAMDLKRDKASEKLPTPKNLTFFFGYFFNAVAKKLGLFRHTTWKRTDEKNVDINTKSVKVIVDRLSKTVQFCYDRDLEPVLVLLSGDADTNCANDIIRAHFAPRGYDIKVEIMKDARQMNEYVRSLI